jgi:peptidoglycan hydrolase CwlO-like protein
VSDALSIKKKRAEILGIEASKEMIEVRILEKHIEISGMQKAIEDQVKRIDELKNELKTMEGN